MRVAIVGGGLFGCTAAIHAARAGHDVQIFEKNTGIMQGASSANQFRLHRGYHYPRSSETGRQCRAGNLSFYEEYKRAIITPERRKHGRQFYCIAKEGSKVTPDQYLAFLNSNDLPYREVPCPPLMVNADEIDLCVAVLESFIDPKLLVDDVARKLGETGVEVHTGAKVTNSLRDDFDRIVVATYAGTGSALRALGVDTVREIQFEVVEKPLVRLPDHCRDNGVVVMDGEFCCIDPYGWSLDHVMGHVEHAIWRRNVGTEPDIPPQLVDYLDRGIVPSPVLSKFNAMKEDGIRFFPVLRDAEYVGSMFTVRAVLPDKDATDARPTLVEPIDDQVIRVFSGKLGTAVDAAMETTFMLQRKAAA